MKGDEDARERIQKLLVTGDNRLKQGVDPAKARESWEQALEVAREAGIEEAVRPLVEVRLADSSGSLEDLLDPLRLTPDVVRARPPRARPRFGTGAPQPSRSARASASTSSGSTSTPASGGTNSGGPPMRVATTGRPHAIPSSSAWPSGSSRLGWQRTCASREAARDLVVRRRGRRAATPVASLELRAQRPVAGERQRPFAEPRERVGEPDDVLALAQRADAEERGPARPARAATANRSRSTPLVDDLRLAARLGQLRLELARAGSRRRRRPPPRADDEPRRSGDAGSSPMLRTSRPWAVTTSGARARERGDQPARDEEVRVDDVGPSARAARGARARDSGACRRARVSSTARSISCPRAVSARSTCATNVAEIGRVRPGIHLRDEEDPHRRSVC